MVGADHLDRGDELALSKLEHTVPEGFLAPLVPGPVRRFLVVFTGGNMKGALRYCVEINVVYRGSIAVASHYYRGPTSPSQLSFCRP